LAGIVEFYIQEGNVRLSVLSKQGKEATIALLGPGEFLGVAGLLSRLLTDSSKSHSQQ
jgi:CRP-like cAMP-binding protein